MAQSSLPNGWFPWYGLYVSDPTIYKCPPLIQTSTPTKTYHLYATPPQLAQEVVVAPALLKVAFGKPLRDFAQTTTRYILPSPTTDLVQTINTTFEENYLPYKIEQHDQASFSEVDHDNLVGVVIIVNKPIQTNVRLEQQTPTQQQQPKPIWVYVHYTVAATLGEAFASVKCVVYSLTAPSKLLCDESGKKDCSGNYVHEMYTGTKKIPSVYPYLEPNLCAFLELMRSATLKEWGVGLRVPNGERTWFDPKHFWHPKIVLDMVPNGSLLVLNGVANYVKRNQSWEQRRLRDRDVVIPEYYSGVWFPNYGHITAKRALFEENTILDYGNVPGLEMARWVTLWVGLCTPGLAGGAYEENRLQGGTSRHVVKYLRALLTQQQMTAFVRTAINDAITTLETPNINVKQTLTQLYKQIRQNLKNKADKLIDEIQNNFDKIDDSTDSTNLNTATLEVQPHSGAGGGQEPLTTSQADSGGGEGGGEGGEEE